MLELDFDEIDPNSMADADYHKHGALSASTVKRLVMNDEYYEVANDIPVEPTAAMNFGSLVHCLILEPYKLSEEFAIMPKVDLRTTAGKAVKADFDASAGDKIIVTEADYETALNCVASFNDSGANALLNGAVCEQKYYSYFDDVPVRGMLDAYDESKARILDIKTTQNFADGFVKECGDRGYYIQAAFYTDLLASLGKPVNDFLFIGIQTKPPHKVTVIRVNEIDIEDGREAYKVGMDIWRDIKANPDKFKSPLCANPSDGSFVFEYVTPMWLRYKIDKLKKQGA